MESTKKQQIIQKYEEEARERDSDAWYAAGGSARVPESRAARYFIDRKVSEALRLLGSDYRRDARVLEIGCSFGHMTALLASSFDTLTAVDISPASVDVASKRMARYGVANVAFGADDAEELHTQTDDSLDVVFSFSTIRFCPNQEKALATIHSKLRRGGVAIIDFPNRYSPWHMFVKAVMGIRRHAHDNLYSRKQVTRLFADTGFEVQRTVVFLFTTKRLPSFALPLFRLVDVVLERTPLLCNLGGIIMIKARKQ